ncbi:hypothetical protein BZA05DRAFT_127310 [Tricharina praecox]|uniref:uncharacterized protein n=1 Tax=Tricharina praecox TaxID=43433 RepID=UPI00221FA56D|nr:uncharacterized protein BZA05DRAFT_127310 [Tricharina praecox]KAI5847607.1 hypothetical protein BZA05DRAFT_127310 [Tricharina praecox]
MESTVPCGRVVSCRRSAVREEKTRMVLSIARASCCKIGRGRMCARATLPEAPGCCSGGSRIVSTHLPIHTRSTSVQPPSTHSSLPSIPPSAAPSIPPSAAPSTAPSTPPPIHPSWPNLPPSTSYLTPLPPSRAHPRPAPPPTQPIPASNHETSVRSSRQARCDFDVGCPLPNYCS